MVVGYERREWDDLLMAVIEVVFIFSWRLLISERRHLCDIMRKDKSEKRGEGEKKEERTTEKDEEEEQEQEQEQKEKEEKRSKR